MIVPVPKSTKSWLASLTDDIAAGAFAGVVSRMLTAPLDVVKIRYQINHNNIVSSPSMWHAMRGIVREEGITALWKGNVPALCLWVSYGAIQFALYSALKKLLAPDPSESKGGEGNGNAVMGMRAFRLFCAGAIASTTATFLTYPFDIIRTQLAIQGNARTFHSMTAMASHAISSKGLPGLYVGMGPALLTITPYMGMNFAMYEFLNNLAKDAHGNTTSGWVHVVQKGALGGIAGGASKLAVYPLVSPPLPLLSSPPPRADK